MVTPNSVYKVWWICTKRHWYPATVGHRYRMKRGCPYCANQKVWRGFNDLESRYGEIAKTWDYKLNKKKPWEVFPNSHDKYNWICENCHMSYPASPANRVKGKGCPYCAGSKRLRDKNSFGALYPQLLKEIHPTKNIDFDPFDVAPKSEKEIYWICELGHDWPARIKKRSMGQGCPYCKNQKIWRGFNDLASHGEYKEIVAEWHPTLNGDLTPEDVMQNTNKKVWWLCPDCGEAYEAYIFYRTKKGTRHSRCKKKY